MIDTVFFDIDGVLTDGMVYIDDEGRETKRISFEDIDAIFRLKRRGIKIGFITGEDNNFADFIKKRFSPDFFEKGCKDKIGYFKKMEIEKECDRTRTCYVGDSEKDIDLLRYVTHSYVPSNVNSTVMLCSKKVTNAKKGCGVIREVVDDVLKIDDLPVPQELKISDISSIIQQHQDVISALVSDGNILKKIKRISEIAISCLQSSNKIILCGNGGSAADAQHIAAEFVGRFALDRKGLHAVALGTNISILTAIANDMRYADIFSRQIDAIGNPGDVVIGISTSGNSPNVLAALKAAKNNNMYTVAFTGGNTDSAICETADEALCIPSLDTPRIQEAHILVGHIICEIVEFEIFKRGGI